MPFTPPTQRHISHTPWAFLFSLALLAPVALGCDNKQTTSDVGIGDAIGDGSSGQDGGGNPQCNTDPWVQPAARALAVEEGSDWSTELDVESEFFSQTGSANSGAFVKFHLALSDKDRPVFQNSSTHLFHHDFARARLTDYKNKTLSEYNAVSLFRANRELLLGTVLKKGNELAIQFAATDQIEPDLVVQAITATLAKLRRPEGTVLYYFPTDAQTVCNNHLQARLSGLGVTIASSSRWASGDECYSNGWSAGRLVRIASDDIDAAFEEGRLLSTDILLTNTVPAEIPPVAGIITDVPATPNSHVALLAQTFGIPFAWVGRERNRRVIETYVGKRVGFQSVSDVTFCDLKVIELEGKVTEAQYSELLAMKTLPELDYQPKRSDGIWFRDTLNLTSTDAQYVGGKAANYGYLRRAVAANVRAPAVGISFDLWDAVLALPHEGSGTLSAFIQSKLGGYRYPITNIQQLKADLESVQDAIKAVDLNDDIERRLIQGLAPFTETKKIRFRSSTNMEDGNTFSGAGLYESFSGCLSDDTDADSAGPSLCDATETSERGVFRAVKRTLASFYNLNAFLERRRFSIDESTVGMGMLAHYSFVDADEEANGVITIEHSAFTDLIRIVSQPGSNSVTNPEGGGTPEEAVIYSYSNGELGATNFNRTSSLLPIGAYVLGESEYGQLARLVMAVRDVFPNGLNISLDLEYKKMRGEGLVLRQVRPLPQREVSSELVTPLVTNKTGTFCAQQQEFNHVLSAHRNRETVSFSTRSFWATDAELQTNLSRRILVKGWDGTNEWEQSFEGSSLVPGNTTDAITSRVQLNANPRVDARTITMHVYKPYRRTAHYLPVFEWSSSTSLSLSPQTPLLDVQYEASQPIQPDRRESAETVHFETCPQDVDTVIKVYAFTSGALNIEAEVVQLVPDASLIKTIPGYAFNRVLIRGLLSDPLNLMRQEASTFGPHHHNFTEDFVFEPDQAEGITEAQKQELRARNIKLLVLFDTSRNFKGEGFLPGTVAVVGYDNTLRAFP